MDYPIVFIPGLFGSLGDDVIKGTGDFSFGLAEGVYRPFIEILSDMGYVEGLNLFISYYDWKSPVLDAVDRYLFPDIRRIIRTTKKSKVILIGHSLGGLLARAYMTYFNPLSVDKLIMIGTPNLGTVNAYYFWSGGETPYLKVEDNILYNGLKVGFMVYFHLFKKTSHLDALRKTFPVVKDLLPSYEYGNYLLYKEGGISEEIPIEDMSIGNRLLNDMEARRIDPKKLFIIGGRGIFTNKELLVEKAGMDGERWKDGKPINAYQTDFGDGTVTVFSAFGNLGGERILIDGNHIDILYKSKDYLWSILNERHFRSRHNHDEWMDRYPIWL